MEDLARFGCDFIDAGQQESAHTAGEKARQRGCKVLGGLSAPFDTDHEDQLRLGGDVVGAFLLAQSGQPDFLALRIAVFLDVGLGPLKDHLTPLFPCLPMEIC